MAINLNFLGTGGIIEGNLGAANVNVNLDPIYGVFNATTSSTLSNDNDFDNIFDGNGGLVSAWIFPKSDGENNYARIFDKNRWSLNFNGESGTNAKIEFSQTFDGDNGLWISNGFVIPYDAWTHVAVFYDSDATGNDPVIYLNGVATAITEQSTPTGTRDSDASDTLYIGNRADGARTFDGYIMDIKIYKNTAWTQPEVAVLASKINVDKDHPGLPAPGPRLYLWWKAIADATTDSSGSGNNLTASNMGSVVYDAFSVDVYDNSTTTDGDFTVTQGKLEGLALTSLHFDGTDDYVNTNGAFESLFQSSHTISSWVKLDDGTPSTNDTILGTFNDGDDRILFYIGTGGLLTYLYQANGTSEYAEEASASFTNGATDWIHCVTTIQYNSTSSATMKLYVNGVERTLDVAGGDDGTFTGNMGNYASSTTAYLGAEHQQSSADEFFLDGKISDVRLYDYALSSDQVASLYSNSYNVTPKHWWKIDDGGAHASGSATVEDYGTGTDSDGTKSGAGWQNGTLDLDGGLTISANGILSAPRGLLTFAGGTFDNNGTDPTTSYIHNDGTFEFDSSGNAILRGGSSSTGTIFFNLFHDSGGYVDTYEYYKVINKLTVDNSRSWYLNGSTHVKIGDTTRDINGELEINGVLNLSSSNTGTGTSNSISGDNTNAGGAALVDINNGASSFANGAAKATEFKNLNFDGAFTTPGNSFIVKCMGDMEFDTVTVISGDTLNINGQRMEATKIDAWDGALTGTTANSMIVYTGTPSSFNHKAGSNSSLTETSIIDQSTLSANINYYYHASCSIKNYLHNHSGGSYYVQPGANDKGIVTENNIIASPWTGYASSPAATYHLDGKNLTIPTGGNMDAGANVIRQSGDFTTSGGLIGKSGLDFEGSGHVQIADDNTLDFTTAMTLEGWVKTTATGNFQHLICKSGGFYFISVYNAGGGATGKAMVRIYDGANIDAIGTSQVNDGKWHHIAGTYDTSAGKLKLYVDGKLEAETSNSDAINTSSTALFLGANDSSGSSNNLTGDLARASVWNVALTEAQIREMLFYDFATADASGTIPDANCKGWWQFDEGTGGNGATTADSAATTNTGTLGPAGTAPNWAGAGTFDGSDAACKLIMTGAGASLNYLTGEVLGHLQIANTSGTVTANVLTGTNNLEISSLEITTSGANFSAPSGTLTINDRASAGYQLYVDDVNDLTHNDGTIDFRGSSGGASDIRLNGASTSTKGFHDVIINASGRTINIGSYPLTIDGKLTLTNGTFNTSGSNYALTVTEEFDHTGGTFTSNSSTVTVRNLVITNTASTTFNAPDGSGMLNITGEGNSGSGDGYAFRRVSGAFVDNSGTVTFKTPTTTQIRMGTAGQNFHNVIIDESSAGGLFYVNDEGFTVTGDLTLTDGDFDTTLGTATPLIDIQGNLTIGNNNTFGGITQTQTSDISIGSVDIGASGATFKATSGTTTITSEKSDYAWTNARGDNGFVHNNGTVVIETAGDTQIKENKFYNLTINLNSSTTDITWRDISGNALKVYGDLTVTRGRFMSNTTSDSIDIYGNTYVAVSHATCWHDADQDTNKITHHGLVTNFGTFKINDGTTVKLNGGIRQLGTLTIA